MIATNIFLVSPILFAVFAIPLVYGATCPPEPQSPRAITRLRQNLLCDYDRLSRPVKKANRTIPVYIFFDVNQLELEEHREVMFIEGIFRLMWVDEYLSWDLMKYEQIAYLKLEEGEMWVPDLTVNLMNNLHGIEELKPSSCVASFAGNVMCLPKVSVQAPCLQDMRHWPYDQHNCSFMLSSYMYYEHQLNISATLSVSSLKSKRVWELVSSSVVRKRINFNSSEPVYYPYVEYSFVIRRHSAFYASATVLPVFLMLFLVLSTFWLGSLTTCRITISGFTVLGCINFLSYLLYLIPANGENVPVIVTLFRDCLALSVFAIIIATVNKVMNESKSKPPVRLTAITDYLDVSFLGRVLLLNDIAMPLEDETAIVEAATTKISPWAPVAVLLDRLAFLSSVMVTVILSMGYLP